MSALTKKRVEALRSNPPKRATIIADGDPAGFGLRLLPSGVASYVFRYRHDGKDKKMSIGLAKNWDLDEARKVARELRVKVDKGVDPLAEEAAAKEARRQEAEAKRAAANAPRVRDMLAVYATFDPASYGPNERVPGKRTQYDVRNCIRFNIIGDPDPKKHVEPDAIAEMKLADVRQEDVEALIARTVSKSGKARGRLVGSTMSRAFVIAQRKGLIDRSPINRLAKPRVESRVRSYRNDEQARLLKALDAMEPDGRYTATVRAVRILALTGARRWEVLGAKWQEFEGLDTDSPLWRKPPERNKAGREHMLPLSRGVVEVLAGMLARWQAPDEQGVRLTTLVERATRESPFLFPAPRRASEYHIIDIQPGWRAILKRAGISGMRIHDLRHAAASLLISEGGERLEVVKEVLGHRDIRTTLIYAHLDNSNKAAAIGKLEGLYKDAAGR